METRVYGVSSRRHSKKQGDPGWCKLVYSDIYPWSSDTNSIFGLLNTQQQGVFHKMCLAFTVGLNADLLKSEQ